MSPAHTITGSVRANQRRAADPEISAWVTANAGAGKTYILTERVLRLLLLGVAPEQILCLTYTKAAAAEMRQRVSDRLADWALLDSADLRASLKELTDAPVTDAQLGRARTLFAYALETPGGLKINTIHAFSESILHRFALEAGVPVDFSVLEDAEQLDMVRAARDGVLSGAISGDPNVADAVTTLFEQLSDKQIETAIAAALASGRQLRPLLADREGAKARLRALVQFDPTRSLAQMNTDIIGRSVLEKGDCRTLVELLNGDPDKQKSPRFVDVLAAMSDLDAPRPDEFRDAFLTASGSFRARLVTKAIVTKYPDLAARFDAERARLGVLLDEMRKANLILRSEALLDALVAIVASYERQKRARAQLDFDDLIERLAALLADPDYCDWVRYKLDSGITHILVDESQDTNPEQWRVVKALAEEFFDGDSAIDRPRTIFAVGDEKQSIYSFQGADPSLFGILGEQLRLKAKNVSKPFARVPMRASFRNLPDILAAVDKVFAAPALAAALLAPAEGVIHESARADPGGKVTLWPPLREQKFIPEDDNWPLEPRDESRTAARRLAEALAKNISDWVVKARPLGSRERAVCADDVLILVQSRTGPLFGEIIRALKNHNLPSPGADRLPVTGHLAVRDLLALAEVMLNPADDLTLAALLRSPLFDIDEDQLFALCHARSGSVWAALADKARAHPWADAAYQRLKRWRDRLDFERPYEFFAHVLYAEGGLKRLHARLGVEIDDVMGVFLDLALAQERESQPSLLGFVAAMRRRDVSIKRELAEAGGGVRVMTVHGAKGLEAPIVILADAASKPASAQLGGPVQFGTADTGPILIHASAKGDHVAQTIDLRSAVEERQHEEYWRKLYVGMTRAEDELYLTGLLGVNAKLENSWYGEVAAALDPETAEVPALEEDGEAGSVYPVAPVPPKPLKATDPVFKTDAQLPEFTPLAAPIRREMVRPSTAGEGGHRQIDDFQTAAESALDAPAARKRGNVLHALLQHLPPIAPADRPVAAERALETLLPDAPDRHAELAQTALDIVADPAFATLFGPNSRPEVPFLADGQRHGKPVRLAGRVDRLVITDNKVLVVDFKSDARPPTDANHVPETYLTQLGLYVLVAKKLFSGQKVTAAILWTTDKTLMECPNLLIEAATKGFTFR